MHILKISLILITLIFSSCSKSKITSEELKFKDYNTKNLSSNEELEYSIALAYIKGFVDNVNYCGLKPDAMWKYYLYLSIKYASKIEIQKVLSKALGNYERDEIINNAAGRCYFHLIAPAYFSNNLSLKQRAQKLFAANISNRVKTSIGVFANMYYNKEQSSCYQDIDIFFNLKHPSSIKDVFKEEFVETDEKMTEFLFNELKPHVPDAENDFLSQCVCGERNIIVKTCEKLLRSFYGGLFKEKLINYQFDGGYVTYMLRDDVESFERIEKKYLNDDMSQKHLMIQNVLLLSLFSKGDVQKKAREMLEKILSPDTKDFVIIETKKSWLGQLHDLEYGSYLFGASDYIWNDFVENNYTDDNKLKNEEVSYLMTILFLQWYSLPVKNEKDDTFEKLALLIDELNIPKDELLKVFKDRVVFLEGIFLNKNSHRYFKTVLYVNEFLAFYIEKHMDPQNFAKFKYEKEKTMVANIVKKIKSLEKNEKLSKLNLSETLFLYSTIKRPNLNVKKALESLLKKLLLYDEEEIKTIYSTGIFYFLKEVIFPVSFLYLDEPASKNNIIRLLKTFANHKFDELLIQEDFFTLLFEIINTLESNLNELNIKTKKNNIDYKNLLSVEERESLELLIESNMIDPYPKLVKYIKIRYPFEKALSLLSKLSDSYTVDTFTSTYKYLIQLQDDNSTKNDKEYICEQINETIYETRSKLLLAQYLTQYINLCLDKTTDELYVLLLETLYGETSLEENQLKLRQIVQNSKTKYAKYALSMSEEKTIGYVIKDLYSKAEKFFDLYESKSNVIDKLAKLFLALPYENLKDFIEKSYLNKNEYFELAKTIIKGHKTEKYFLELERIKTLKRGDNFYFGKQDNISLLVNGGYSVTSNYPAFEENLKKFQTFFANEEAIILNAGNYDKIYKHSGSTPTLFPTDDIFNIASKGNVLDTIEKLAEKEPKIFAAMYTDHGGPLGLAMWGGGHINASDLRKSYDKFPEATMIRSIFLQCFSGNMVVEDNRVVPKELAALSSYFNYTYPDNRCAVAQASEFEIATVMTDLYGLLEESKYLNLSDFKNFIMKFRSNSTPVLSSDYFLTDLKEAICNEFKSDNGDLEKYFASQREMFEALCEEDDYNKILYLKEKYKKIRMLERKFEILKNTDDFFAGGDLEEAEKLAENYDKVRHNLKVVQGKLNNLTEKYFLKENETLRSILVPKIKYYQNKDFDLKVSKDYLYDKLTYISSKDQRMNELMYNFIKEQQEVFVESFGETNVNTMLQNYEAEPGKINLTLELKVRFSSALRAVQYKHKNIAKVYYPQLREKLENLMDEEPFLKDISLRYKNITKCESLDLVNN